MASESPDSILIGLHAAAVEHIVVEGTAAVLLGAPVVTEDLESFIGARLRMSAQRSSRSLCSVDSITSTGQ